MNGSRSDRVRGLSGEPPATFRGFLSRLKQRGSGLLVTGETTAWVQQHASRQLFGATRLRDDEAPRRRVVVRTASDVDPAKYLPTGTEVGDERVRVVSHTQPTRSAAAATASSFEVSGPTITDGPTELAQGVVEAIESLASLNGEIEAGELRVGVTSLQPLVEAAGVDAVVEFCETVTETVRSYGGMAHFHYPVSDADALTLNLDDLLDARIELRQRGGDPVQCRWHTPYPELNEELGWVDFG
jgi:hypothetical protein